MYPVVFNELVEFFKSLPGVGTKSAERYSFSVLELSTADVEKYSECLLKAKMTIRKCSVCYNMCENEKCSICNDNRRDESLICVVQSAKDVIAIERMQEYRGVYHVLGGVISASKGIMPEDLEITSLTKRLNDKVKEVIIATNPTVDGEITALYISKVLANEKILITRIAHGIPMGGHLDYADELTLIKAMEGRKSYKGEI